MSLNVKRNIKFNRKNDLQRPERVKLLLGNVRRRPRHFGAPLRLVERPRSRERLRLRHYGRLSAAHRAVRAPSPPGGGFGRVFRRIPLAAARIHGQVLHQRVEAGFQVAGEDFRRLRRPLGRQIGRRGAAQRIEHRSGSGRPKRAAKITERLLGGEGGGGGAAPKIGRGLLGRDLREKVRNSVGGGGGGRSGKVRERVA